MFVLFLDVIIAVDIKRFFLRLRAMVAGFKFFHRILNRGSRNEGVAHLVFCGMFSSWCKGSRFLIF